LKQTLEELSSILINTGCIAGDGMLGYLIYEMKTCGVRFPNIIISSMDWTRRILAPGGGIRKMNDFEKDKLPLKFSEDDFRDD